MVKAHKRKNSDSMRRASRGYLTQANVGKVAALRASLLLYINVVNYFIERFWTMKDFTPALADKVITGRAVNRFKITARLARGRRQAGQRDRPLAERSKDQDDALAASQGGHAGQSLRENRRVQRGGF
jgi:hypothetical protein